VALWLTEPLHGLNPALVAIAGGVVAMLPVIGIMTPQRALDAVPWSLLLFLATTLAFGAALVGSGAADRITAAALGMLSGGSPVVTRVAVVAVSAAAHLFVQSPSARSTVLVPMVLVTATAVGLNPVAAALASTAVARFCLTLTSSAKPVAMFLRVRMSPRSTAAPSSSSQCCSRPSSSGRSCSRPSGYGRRSASPSRCGKSRPFHHLKRTSFPPQKSASPAQVDKLAKALKRWATVLEADVPGASGQSLRRSPGTGASGGLGAGQRYGLDCNPQTATMPPLRHIR
jgi:Glycerate kinase family/Citrate transporter